MATVRTYVATWPVAWVLSTLAVGCGGAMPDAAGRETALASVARESYFRHQIGAGKLVEACPEGVPAQWRCDAVGLRDTNDAPRSEDAGHGSVAGYGPSQLQAAYNITSEAKTKPGGLVALVEIGGYERLASDLAVYRKQFGLPRCDKSSGCLRIVNQYGKKAPLPPSYPSGGVTEQALDVDMVSANCPHCEILVVQAESDFGKGVFIAERTAARMRPVAIANTWGQNEFKGEARNQQRYFHHPGIAITVSAGDGPGYGPVNFPAVAETVTAVGGTSLRRARNKRGWTEAVWDTTVSGCSRYIPAPSWQLPIEQKLGGCSNRIVADVAYDADPETGVAVYDSVPGDGHPPGWQVWGGTSVGGPAIAAIYALSGNTSGIPASLAYANPGDLYDVTKGSNGDCAPYYYLCTGEVGYNGPTGNGTPDGLGAF
jgi:subtilase family serine protease